MNVKTLSDVALLAIWRAFDSEIRSRKIKSKMPAGEFSVESLTLHVPDATVVRKEALRAPTIHASPSRWLPSLVRRGRVGPALQSLIVDGLSVAAAGNLHQSLALAGVNEAEVKDMKAAIAKGCPKVPMVRTTVKWGE